MKDRYLIWCFFPFIFIFGLTYALYLNYEILFWKEEIINFIPYSDDVFCVGCCTVRCYEFALSYAIKTQIILPYFIVIVAIIFIVAALINTYFEIKKENEGELN